MELPSTARNMRAMFESGEVPKKEIKRQSRGMRDEPPPESGTFESAPEQHREGVVRSDSLIEEGGVIAEGYTKNVLNQWGQQKAAPKRAPVRLAEDQGCVVESQPVVRDNVTRESDMQEETKPQAGNAKDLRNQYISKANEPKNIKRQPVKLFEGNTEPIVAENEPEVRSDDVIRSGEYYEEVSVESGKARDLAGYWATRSDDVDIKREAVKIDRGEGVVVHESEPERRDDVVRESDIPDTEHDITIEAGSTRNAASRFQDRGDDGPRERKQPIKIETSDGPMISENQPLVRDDVVRGDEYQDDLVPTQEGRTKDILNQYMSKDFEYKKEKRPIVMEKSDGPAVVENEPEYRDDVVRSDVYQDDVSLDTGRTRNMVDQWVQKEEQSLTPKTSSGGGLKSSWMQEIEGAKDGGVYENEPEARPECVRESDYNEEPDLIPDRNAKSMKNLWVNMEASKEAQPRDSQLVRFTPPREMTPPPVHQQARKSVHKLTLANSVDLAEQNNSCEPEQNNCYEQEANFQQAPASSSQQTSKKMVVLRSS